MDRWAVFNDTAWNERGFGVYFSYDDLLAQGKLSSDLLQPWKRVLEDVLVVARKYKQVYVTIWYPHQFGGKERRSTFSARKLIEKESVVEVPVTGATHTETNEDGDVLVYGLHRLMKEQHEKYRHINVIQQVVPTRTGLDGIKCSAAVWVSAINGSEPFSLLHKLPKDW
jgi:hypothetical protein